MSAPDFSSIVRKATAEYIYKNNQCTITYTLKHNKHLK